MMHVERADFWMAIIFLSVALLLARYRPSIEGIHSLVSLANTKGGIILILWVTSLLFFLAGLRLSYWAIQLQVTHPDDKAMAWLNAVFGWISGGAFMGAFGAMIAMMRGESAMALPTSTATQTTTVIATESKAT